jgi:hypothetical protein
MKYTIIIPYSFHSDWLKLTWQERGEYERKHLRPVFEKFANSVTVRFFDAEAFSARHSDFMILETDDMKHYYYLIESLRESQIFKDGLVEFKDVLLGIEDGFRSYEQEIMNS